MRLFLDSANVREARVVASWGVLSGVTTNPTQLAAEGVNEQQRVAELSQVAPGQVTVTLRGRTSDELIAAGKEVASTADNLVVQFPVNPEGLAACRLLSEAGVKVNLLLVFSAAQAVLAANAGAAFVSPFIGRVDDIGMDGMVLLEEIAQIYAVQGYPTEILAMSLRHPGHVIGAAHAGADAAAVPYDVFLQMVSHPLTDLGSERFSEDWSGPMQRPDSPEFSTGTYGSPYGADQQSGYGFEQPPLLSAPGSPAGVPGPPPGYAPHGSDEPHTYEGGYELPPGT